MAFHLLIKPRIIYLCVCMCAYLSALVSKELAGVVDDLFIGEIGVRLLLTDAQHLPQSDSERPRVAGGGEFTLETRKHNTKRQQQPEGTWLF